MGHVSCCEITAPPVRLRNGSGSSSGVSGTQFVVGVERVDQTIQIHRLPAPIRNR